jgi:hypothetical protein
MNRLLALACLLLVALPSYGMIIAQDDASQAAYNDGWQASDNGGFGFGAWNFFQTSGSSGTFIGNSGNNGSGTASPNINTGGRAWGIWANNSSLFSASRAVNTANPGDIVRASLDMDNGFIDGGSITGNPFGVSGGVTLGGTVQGAMGVIFRGGQNGYDFFYGSTSTAVTYVSAGIGFTSTGVEIDVVRNSATSFTVNLKRLSDSSMASHTFMTPDNHVIIGIGIQNTSAGTTSSRDAFFNNFEVEAVPEPGTILLGAGLAAMAARRRK